MRRDKIFFGLNALVFAAGIAMTLYYNDHRSLFLKGMTSSFFVLLGLVNAVYSCIAKKGRVFSCTMAAGLLLAMLGDVLLGVDFYMGMGAFALGHVLYLTAFCVRARPRWADLIPAAALFAFALWFLEKPFLHFGYGPLKMACAAYAAIICLMTGKAISDAVRRHGLADLVLAIGSAMFFFSDIMLVCSMFGPGAKIFDTLCVATYFPGQLVLGIGVYFTICVKERP